MRSFHVKDLLNDGGEGVELELIAGAGGLDRPISSTRVQRPGMALCRENSQLRANRLFIFGKSELRCLEDLTPRRRMTIFRDLALMAVPCIILEAAVHPPEDLRSFSQEQGIPLLLTHGWGARLTRTLQHVLTARLGPEFNIQGVLMRVFGVGVLILGKSGIGKSECALDLITRGHALVADDVVVLKRDKDGMVLGTSPELIRHHMEVRGLGIIDILELFGHEAVAQESYLEMVVEFLEWKRFVFVDRTGLSQMTYTILETDIPLFRIPVSLNRNLAIILEVAVRNHILRRKGIRSVERLERHIESQLRPKASS
jgi:HPr kinase/phosphorylase